LQRYFFAFERQGRKIERKRRAYPRVPDFVIPVRESKDVRNIRKELIAWTHFLWKPIAYIVNIDIKAVA